jgi:phage terminase small subunit
MAKTSPTRVREGVGPALTPKQQRFVSEYLIDLNATQAAIRAGYSPKTANQQGSRLLVNVGVAEAIRSGATRQLHTAELSAVRVLEEFRRLAFLDMRSFFDANGNMKPMGELTADQGAALAGLEVIVKNAEAGDGVTDRVHKFKVWDKTRALDSLAKHFGLLTENVQHHGEIRITWAS